MAESSYKEIQIRTLTGESITISISSTRTVRDLKLLLKSIFPPAVNTPNFHLFFERAQLRLEDQISCYNIESPKFVVLVPFAKKESIQTKKSDHSKKGASVTSSTVADRASISNLAESTWSNIMEDLTYLRESETDSNALNDDNNTSAFKFGRSTDEPKPTEDFDSEKQLGLSYHLTLNELQSTSEGALGDHNCQVFVKHLESVNCLTDLSFGHCKLFRKAQLKGGVLGSYANNDSSCLCPPWLNIVMKAFSFINIFSAFLHLQCKKTTATLLEEALSQLGKFGIKLGIQDMKHLALLCPKLICFQNDEEKTCSDDIIVVINHPTRDKDQIGYNPKREVRKQLKVSKVVSTLKRRDRSFRNNLWQIFEQQHLFGDKMAVETSLEDLLSSIKHHQSSTGNENKAKRMKRSSTSSKYSKNHIWCHDTTSLMALEMVEHLQRGIGSEGQIVHVEDISTRKAIHAEIPIELSKNMRSALESIGISKLYSHQVESVRASLTGKDVVVATMTSSGKSLCYNLPVLEVLSKNSSSCALYIFPTKALAQDQLRALLGMTKGFNVDFIFNIVDHKSRYVTHIYLASPSAI